MWRCKFTHLICGQYIFVGQIGLSQVPRAFVVQIIWLAILAAASRRAEEAEVFMVATDEMPIAFEANRLKHIQSKQSITVALRVVKDGKIG